MANMNMNSNGQVGSGGDSEPFLPTYLYDAMKAKKGFDGM
jgi:hypothetical protein